MNTQRISTRGAIGLLGAVAILLLAAVSAHAGSPGARIVSATGTVEILGAPTGQWAPAAAPAVLAPGSALRTGQRSSAVLELDGATVTLYDTSLIRIPAAAAPASTRATPLRHPWLDSGRALFDVTPRTQPAPFSVRTPMIVAGVKGTVFEVVATGTQQAVYVWRGLVEVVSVVDQTDVQLVSAGHFTMLDHLRLIPPTGIPTDREEPAGLDSHPATAATTARAGAPTTEPIDHVMRDRTPLGDARPDRKATNALPIETDPFVGLWLDADSAALQGALDDARDFQTVVSTGELRTVRTIPSTTDATTNSVTSTATDPLSSTGSSLTTTVDSPLNSTTAANTLVTDPLSGTVSTMTTTVDSTLHSTTSALSSTLEPVTDTTSGVVSTVSSPLGLLGF